MITVQERERFVKQLRRDAMRANEVSKAVSDYELQETIDFDSGLSLWRFIGWVPVLVTAVSLVSYFIQ